jgi:hypothetical protein
MTFGPFGIDAWPSLAEFGPVWPQVLVMRDHLLWSSSYAACRRGALIDFAKDVLQENQSTWAGLHFICLMCLGKY